MKTIAIIPARAGSRGIPRKNAQCVGGVPLVARSVYHASDAGIFDTIAVSTEDRTMGAIARSAGAWVVSRPGEFATDTATLPSVVAHGLRQLDADVDDRVVMLMPTYPFRDASIIRNVIDFHSVHGGDSAVCRIPLSDHPFLCFTQGPEHRGIPLRRPIVYSRQQRPDAFAICLYVTVFKAGALPRLDDGFWNESTVFYPLDSKPIDIDTMDDLRTANEVCNASR